MQVPTLMIVAAVAASPGISSAEDNPAEDLDGEFGIQREPAVSISPRYSPSGGNSLNREFTAGLSITVQPHSAIGIETNLSFFPLGGAENATVLAGTTLGLNSRPVALESLDRVLALTFGVIVVPLSGYIAPPGLPGVHAEFLCGGGAGVEVVSIEMLALEDEAVTLAADPESHAHPVVMGLLGARIVPIPPVAFRIDARVMGGAEQALDYSADLSTAVNRSLPQGILANRLLCRDETSDAMCSLRGYGAVTVEVAIEFTFGARRVRK